MDRAQTGENLTGRYWLVATDFPRWVPVIELDQVSDEEWSRMVKRQPWWYRLYLRWTL